MDIALYNHIKEKYGQYSSLAIWDGKDTGAWADREYQQVIDSGKDKGPASYREAVAKILDLSAAK